ncbi:hypothetical protein RND71_022333 [Anisodus tanguticus]|uniref:Pollen Ole e 1 allergen and extensin family protein n=1 Tax=Anisodus tanguticus TaxID=243964 RepID=A0AAE1RWU1_9SOLA|nr:hypothetical protein RND71_022333 [Anisodus tanguticus]
MIQLFQGSIMMMIFIFSFLLIVPISWGININNNPLVELSSREELAKMAGYGEEKLSTVILHGTLLCGDHTPQPVPGASVAVFCGTSGPGKVRRSSWAQNITDESGEFVIDVPSHLHANIDDPNLCHFQILHLPQEYSVCDHHSFTKRKQYTLTSSNIGSDGIRIYTTPTIHLTLKASS